MEDSDRKPRTDWDTGKVSADAAGLGSADTLLVRVAALATEIGELKRVRSTGRAGSVSDQLFRRAWGLLCGGEPASEVARTITAASLVACQLGAIDDEVLAAVGVGFERRSDIISQAFDAAVAGVPAAMVAWLRPPAAQPPVSATPAFVDALAAQPRAGATAPGHPRLVLEPSESHSEHCLTVAVVGVLLATREGADPSRVFLAGLAHHLHNAQLPDSGFAGELLLGDSLAPIMRELFAREIATLPPRVGEATRDALEVIADADTPEGRAFHIADVFDRVLQVRYHDRAARFRAEQALGDMDLVHAGPLQSFHKSALRQAGLL